MPDDPVPVLEVSGLKKTFFMTEPPARVLDGIDLVVHDGDFLAIMGPSGSGKSTLLYSVSGMDRPTGGTVLLRGQDITTLDDVRISRVRLHEMGFVFQQPYFLANLSIQDNILLPALKAKPRAQESAVRRVEALMERFDIAHVAHQGTTEVSGGQLQRAALCRALASQPSIVFADEPTGALNSSMTLEVMDALREVHREGTTIVMVTHDPGCAARADRVIYLRDGVLYGSWSLGAWQAEDSKSREEELLDWLSSLGF